MRKVFLLFIMIVMASTAIAQSIDDADNLFNEGNYKEAKLIYYKYKSKNSIAEKRYTLCSTLEGLYSTAVDLYNAKKYNSALKVCKNIFNSNPVCAKTKKLERKCNDAIRQLQQERQQKFDSACESRSEEKLKAFQKEYSNQSEWVEKAEEVIEDLRAYKIAEQKNTREAYQAYVNSSTKKIYESEANYKIGEFDCHAMWSEIKDNRNKEQFENYINKYSSYDYQLNVAKANIKLLSAEEAAKSKNWESAYADFSDSFGKASLLFTKEDSKMFDVATMVHKYNALGSNASQNELLSYMKMYPKSPCYDEASDRIALLKAEKLTIFSSVSERNDAYYYAISDYMKQKVQNILDRKLKEKRRYNRREYGPKVTVGLGLNGVFYKNAYDAGLGLYMRIGRFNQILNGIIGVKYEAKAQYESSGIKDDSYDDYSPRAEYKNFIVANQVIIPVGLRFNIARLSKKCSMYIGGKAEYGLSFKGDLKSDTDYKIGKVLKKNTLAYYPEIGIHSHHWDFNLYYKFYSKDPFLSVDENPNINFVNPKTLETKNYGGFSLSCYF